MWQYYPKHLEAILVLHDSWYDFTVLESSVTRLSHPMKNMNPSEPSQTRPRLYPVGWQGSFWPRLHYNTSSKHERCSDRSHDEFYLSHYIGRITSNKGFLLLGVVLTWCIVLGTGVYQSLGFWPAVLCFLHHPCHFGYSRVLGQSSCLHTNITCKYPVTS